MRVLYSFIFVGALASAARAHVGISSGPVQAKKSAVITFSVGHGCEEGSAPNVKHLDTKKVRITVPAGFTSVRAFYSDFGKPTLVKSGTTVTHVEWTKPQADLLAADDSYYELKIRVSVGDMPFSRHKWSIEQTCEDPADNSTVVVNWNEDEGGSALTPATYLNVLPARTSGWNKVTMPRALTQDEVALYFGDAQIVWRGTAAYSGNSVTAMLIAMTNGVTAITEGLAANDEIWVKY